MKHEGLNYINFRYGWLKPHRNFTRHILKCIKSNPQYVAIPESVSCYMETLLTKCGYNVEILPRRMVNVMGVESSGGNVVYFKVS